MKTLLRRTAFVIGGLVLLFFSLNEDSSIAVRIAMATLSRTTLKPGAQSQKTTQWTATLNANVFESHSQGGVAGHEPCPGSYVYSAKVRMNVDAPPTVYADSSFVVRASDLSFSDFVTRDLTCLVEKPIKDPHWNAGTVRLLFERRSLGLTLSPHNGGITPDGVTPLRDGAAQWVVRAHRIGSDLEIGIQSFPEKETAASILNIGKNQEVSFYVSEDSSNTSRSSWLATPIPIQVVDRVAARAKWVSWIGICVGALLSLSGILAFP